MFADLLKFQTASGAFASEPHLQSRIVTDENSFITSLILLQLAHFKEDPQISEACKKAADFLLKCSHAGAFWFYALGEQPAWIREALPADIDDTALGSLALFRAGLWTRDQLRQQVDLLGRYRIAQIPRGAAWFRAGVFPTWMSHSRMRNAIDLCVNVNVLALLAAAEASPARSEGILEMIEAALDWAGTSGERARLLIPYYAHPAELAFALARAAAFGCSDANGLLVKVQAQSWSVQDNESSSGICCSLGGGAVWHSKALAIARNLEF
jgi:hypothetical protein